MLEKESKFCWSELQEKDFQDIKKSLTSNPVMAHFNISFETIVTCDASIAGLGATLEQIQPSGERRIVAYASRFLDDSEKRYPVTEFELLGLVWSIENFEYYLCGREFTVFTDRKALLTLLKPNRSNICHLFRLSRWIARLMRFIFRIQHYPGKFIGIADFLSRNPCNPAVPESFYDETFAIRLVEHLSVINLVNAKEIQLNVKTSLPAKEKMTPVQFHNENTCKVNKPLTNTCIKTSNQLPTLNIADKMFFRPSKPKATFQAGKSDDQFSFKARIFGTPVKTALFLTNHSNCSTNFPNLNYRGGLKIHYVAENEPRIIANLSHYQYDFNTDLLELASDSHLDLQIAVTINALLNKTPAKIHPIFKSIANYLHARFGVLLVDNKVVIPVRQR
ncbi:MAG: ribonuclease H family protein, partial [Bacteroidota bacterium]